MKTEEDYKTFKDRFKIAYLYGYSIIQHLLVSQCSPPPGYFPLVRIHVSSLKFQCTN